MYVKNLIAGDSIEIEILKVEDSDFRKITKARFWFNWKAEKDFDVYKLCIKSNPGEILGLISLETIVDESRVEIRLLAVSKDNRGRLKKYDRIAGNLITFAGIESIKQFGEMACISLVPKTELIEHYMKEYSMQRAGRSLFLDGKELQQLIINYDYE